MPAELLNYEFLIRNEFDIAWGTIDNKFDFIILQEFDILNWSD